MAMPAKVYVKDANENYLCGAGDLNIEDISNCYPKYKYIYLYKYESTLIQTCVNLVDSFSLNFK